MRCFLTNNPSFISSQICNAISHYDHKALLIIPPITSHQNHCSLISADTSAFIVKFDIPFETESCSLKLVTEVHGMLLLTDLHVKYAYRELYMWNPYVKRHGILASTCFKKLLDDRNRIHCVFGMAFDKATDDYKVIRIIYVKDDKRNLYGEVAPKVEIYSFRKNMKDSKVPRLVYECGIYVNDFFYWLEMKQRGTEETRTCYGNKLRIMSFNFHDELFGEFKVPHDVSHDLGRFPRISLCSLRIHLLFVF